MSEPRQTFAESVEETVRMLHQRFADAGSLKRCAAFCTGVLRGYYLCGLADDVEYEKARDALWELADLRMRELAEWDEFDAVMSRELSEQGKEHGN